MRKIQWKRLVKMSAVAVIIGLAGWATNANAQAPDAAQKPYSSKTQKKCMACHLAEYQSLKKQKHTKAFDDLTGNYKQDKSCLECHTTGYGEPTGFKSIADTPQLAGVTCEACHGPAGEHIRLGDEISAKEKKDPAYGTEKKPSEAWTKDNELRLKAIKRLEVPGLKVEKGKVAGTKTNVHDVFETYKNDKGEPMNVFLDACKKCHKMENGKKVHPEYKK